MKFQDPSFNGSKVTVGIKNVTDARKDRCTDEPKAICPSNFFKVWGIIKLSEKGILKILMHGKSNKVLGNINLFQNRAEDEQIGAEQIRCVFDILLILLISSEKPILWVLIRMASAWRFSQMQKMLTDYGCQMPAYTKSSPMKAQVS